MMMYTFDLSEKMKPKGVTVNCLDPGTVNTKMLLAGQQASYPLFHVLQEDLEIQCAICHFFGHQAALRTAGTNAYRVLLTATQLAECT